MFSRLQRRVGLRDPEVEDEESEPFPELPGGFSPVPVFSPNNNTTRSASAGSSQTESPIVPSHDHRDSRASSVISTRTGVTIGTLHDDARSVRSIRSVDLSLGGRLFHINRDASRISVTDEERLPPYEPPAPSYSQQNETMPRTHPTSTSQQAALSDPEKGSGSASRMAGISRGLDALAGASANAVEGQQQTSQRSPSFSSGPERLSMARASRRASIGPIPDEEFSRGNDVAQTTQRLLRRRKGGSLPRLPTHTTESNLGTRRASLNLDTASTNDVGLQSTGASSSYQEFRRPPSPPYSRTTTARSFLDSRRPQASRRTTGSSSHGRPQTRRSEPSLAVPESPAQIDEGDVRTEAPPAMDTENDISIHYSRLIRSIDRDQRQALHVRDKELATMRERLNEVDKVYRKELKSRDFTIDDLQKRLHNLERDLQSRIEQAQNRIEDEWEMRWKHRDRHLMERMRRMELESQKQVERAVAQRDEEWVAQLQKQNSELFGKLGVGNVGEMQQDGAEPT